MSITTVKAVSYETMADYLRGDDALHLCAQLAAGHDRVWIISVTNSPQCPLNVFEAWDDGPAALVEDGEDRLALAFDDIEPREDQNRGSERFVYFDDTMARRVCAFLRRAHGDDPTRRDLLLVNCHAGVSRSGAIADFARAVAGVDYDAFRRMNPQIVPNAFVRRLLLSAWQETGLSDAPDAPPEATRGYEQR